MSRLTDHDKTGNWQLHGVDWKQLREGEIITGEVEKRLYGALCKLRDYENIDEEPGQLKNLKNAVKTGRRILAKEIIHRWAKDRRYKSFEKGGEVRVMTEGKCVKFSKNDFSSLWEYMAFWLDQELERKQRAGEWKKVTESAATKWYE